MIQISFKRQSVCMGDDAGNGTYRIEMPDSAVLGDLMETSCMEATAIMKIIIIIPIQFASFGSSTLKNILEMIFSNLLLEFFLRFWQPFSKQKSYR